MMAICLVKSRSSWRCSTAVVASGASSDPLSSRRVGFRSRIASGWPSHHASASRLCSGNASCAGNADTCSIHGGYICITRLGTTTSDRRKHPISSRCIPSVTARFTKPSGCDAPAKRAGARPHEPDPSGDSSPSLLLMSFCKKNSEFSKKKFRDFKKF